MASTDSILSPETTQATRLDSIRAMIARGHQFSQQDVIAEALRLGFRWEQTTGDWRRYLTNEPSQPKRLTPTHHIVCCATCDKPFAVTQRAWNQRKAMYGYVEEGDAWYCSKRCTGAATIAENRRMGQ